MLYPKQSQTRCVLDLNGIWDLAREHEKCGQERGFEAEKKVAVPCSYNDLYAEEGFRMWSGGVWYSRTFVVPRALRGERLVLRFGSVAYSAEVYVNGLIAGAHAGGLLTQTRDGRIRLWDLENLAEPTTTLATNSFFFARCVISSTTSWATIIELNVTKA